MYAAGIFYGDDQGASNLFFETLTPPGQPYNCSLYLLTVTLLILGQTTQQGID